jgi:ABC-type nitrate/sulfonate/bicarbonate transport system substrate-binding protein
MSKRTFLGIIFLIVIGAVGIGLWSVPRFRQKLVESLEKVTLASMPHSFTGYSVFIALEKGYFQDEGVNLRLHTTYPHGKAILQAAIAGEADLGTSSETPFMHAVLNGGKIYAFIR